MVYLAHAARFLVRHHWSPQISSSEGAGIFWQKRRSPIASCGVIYASHERLTRGLA